MTKPYGYGYHILNTIDGKLYAGQTRDLETRLKQHLYAVRTGGGYYLHVAMRKHGPDAFEFIPVFEAKTKEELDAWEKGQISGRNLMDPAVGYNLTPGGDGITNLPPEIMARRVSAYKDTVARAEVKARKSASSKAANARPETKAKQSAALRKAFACPEVRAKRSAYAKAHNACPDYKAKHHAGQKAAWSDPDIRAKRTESNRATNYAGHPNVFFQGMIFRSMSDLARHLACNSARISFRCKSTSNRFRWLHTIPNHNDPECDAVEECFAIAQWAMANPDHEKVPEWTRAFRFAEHRPPSTPGRLGPAPAWAKRAAA